MSCYLAEPDPFPALHRTLRVVAAARTDCGRERPDNQDRALLGDAAAQTVWEPPTSVAVDVLPGAFYAVVCDGMGGEAGGNLASGLAVEVVGPAMGAAYARSNVGRSRSRTNSNVGRLSDGTAGDEISLARALAASLEAAAARIKEVARAEPAYARMGTTATLAAIAGDAFVCAQVGDSRAYVLRGSHLVQVTRDQTMAELLRSSGSVAPDRIGEIVGPNVILQALGSSARLEIAITRTPLAEGDVFLLCSDGLHGSVPDEAIAAILGSSRDPGEACAALIARANENGGPDNISCIVGQITGGDLAAPTGSPSCTAVLL